MFKVGDIIVGLPDNGYTLTTEHSVCKVLSIEASKTHGEVKILKSTKYPTFDGSTHTIALDDKHFVLKQRLKLPKEIKAMRDTLTVEPPKKVSRAEKTFSKQKKTVRSAIMSATEQFKKKNQYDNPTHAFTDKEVQIINDLSFWKNNYSSDQSMRLSRIISQIIGKTIPDIMPAAGSVLWVRFAAIVINNQGGHNYPLHSVAIITADQKGIRPDGTFGNVMDTNKNYYLPATAEDMNKISDEQYASLIREFLVMS